MIDRSTLLARLDSIRQFARGGRRAPHKPLLLLYALGRLKHDRQSEVRFNDAEAVVRPLLVAYGPRGTKARVADPFGRLQGDHLWRVPDREMLTDRAGNVRGAVARKQNAPAGFTPEVLELFAREPELIDVAAMRLLERHFAPSLHEEILKAVGLELGARRTGVYRRDLGFRTAVLEAYFAECSLCGFSLRLADGLIGVDAAHIRWHAHGGPDVVSNGIALCALHHRLFDHGVITVLGDYRVRLASAVSGISARSLAIELDGKRIRLPIDQRLHPASEHIRWHHAQVFHGDRRGL